MIDRIYVSEATLRTIDRYGRNNLTNVAGKADAHLCVEFVRAGGETVPKWVFDNLINALQPAWDYIQTHQDQFGAIAGDDKNAILVEFFLRAAAASEAGAEFDAELDARLAEGDRIIEEIASIVRAPAQAAEPVAWVRKHPDTGKLSGDWLWNDVIEECRKDSGVWFPLGFLTAPPLPPPASALDEEAFVVKRLSESLADVYTTLIGDDKVDVDDNLNAIQRVERAAQVLRLELELYRAQASAPVVLTDSARDVLAERRRQIEREGWTPARDDQYRDHELSCAAGCYAMYTLAYPAGDPPPAWPWAADWWKPTTHRRNLVKAGALILAEIERIDRDAARTQGS